MLQMKLAIWEWVSAGMKIGWLVKVSGVAPMAVAVGDDGSEPELGPEAVRSRGLGGGSGSFSAGHTIPGVSADENATSSESSFESSSKSQAPP